MANRDDYKNKPYGFDRTQMFKEYESPMLHRISALKMAQTFFDTNEIKHTPTELKAAYLRFWKLIDDGDLEVFDVMQNYLNKKGITLQNLDHHTTKDTDNLTKVQLHNGRHTLSTLEE
jgi:hypothetical protein